MGYFPRTPRPPKRTPKPAERRPRDWRRQTHVAILAGTHDWDGAGICAECGFREEHAIHRLDQTTHVEATELERRKLGEGSDG